MNNSKNKALEKAKGVKKKLLFDKEFRDSPHRGIYAGKSLETAMAYEQRRKARDSK